MNLNPRQVAATERLLRTQRNLLRFVWLFWALPRILAIAAFRFDWHWSVKTISVIAVASGVIQHLAEANAARDYKRRLASRSNGGEQ